MANDDYIRRATATPSAAGDYTSSTPSQIPAAVATETRLKPVALPPATPQRVSALWREPQTKIDSTRLTALVDELFLEEDGWSLEEWVQKANQQDASGLIAELTKALVSPNHPHHEPVLWVEEPDEEEAHLYQAHTTFVQDAYRRLVTHLNLPVTTVQEMSRRILSMARMNSWQTPVVELIGVLTLKQDQKGFFYWDGILPLAERLNPPGQLARLMGELRSNPDLLADSERVATEAEKLACTVAVLKDLQQILASSARERPQPVTPSEPAPSKIRSLIEAAVADQALSQLDKETPPPPQLMTWQKAAALGRIREKLDEQNRLFPPKPRKARRPSATRPPRTQIKTTRVHKLITATPTYPTGLAKLLNSQFADPATKQDNLAILQDLGWEVARVQSFFSGKDLPKNFREAKALSDHLGFKDNKLVNAWAWDKTRGFGEKYPLDRSLSASEENLALKLRYILWRVHDGKIGLLIGRHYDTPLYHFLTTGNLPLNSHNADLPAFYDELQKHLAHKFTWKPGEVRQFIAQAREAHYERLKNELTDWTKNNPIQTSWPKPVQELVALARKAIAMQFGRQYTRALPSFNGAFHLFVLEGRIPSRNHPDLTLKAFYGQIEQLIAGDDTQRRKQIQPLIEDVVRVDRKLQDGWVAIMDIRPESVQTVVDFFRTHIIRRFGGVIPGLALGGVSENSALRTLLITGQIKLRNEGTISLATVRDQFVELCGGPDKAIRVEAKKIFENAIAGHLQWQAREDLPQMQKALLLWARRGALQNFAGLFPDQHFSHQVWLERYLASGILPTREKTSFNTAEFFNELRQAATTGQQEKAVSLLVEKAIFSVQGWGTVAGGEQSSSATGQLLFNLRRQVARNDGGILFYNGSRGIPRRSPFHVFIQSGEGLPQRNFGKLPLKEFYWNLLLTRLTENGGLPKAEARALIYRSIFETFGWQSGITDKSTHNERLLYALREIVANEYGGAVSVSATTPSGDLILSKGSGLERLIDNGSWPEKEFSRAWQDLYVSARKFLAYHGADTDLVDSMLTDLQAGMRLRKKTVDASPAPLTKTAASPVTIRKPVSLIHRSVAANRIALSHPHNKLGSALWRPTGALLKVVMPAGFAKNAAFPLQIPGRI